MSENPRCMMQPENEQIECMHAHCEDCGYNPEVARERRAYIRKKYGLKHQRIIYQLTYDGAKRKKKNDNTKKVTNEQMEQIKANIRNSSIRQSVLRDIIGDDANDMLRFKLEDFQQVIWTDVDEDDDFLDFYGLIE